MAQQEKRLELEPAVTIGGRELIPVAWTVGAVVVKNHTARAVMCREAFGVIVRDDNGLYVYLVDGRTLSPDEFVSIYPSLADAIAALQ